MSLSFVVSTGRCGSALLSRLLRANTDILSLSELFGLLPMAERLAGRPGGKAFWRQLADPVPFIDAMVGDGLPMPEFRYPYATGRYSPRRGVPFISHMTLPALTDDPDALFDRLAAIVPTWPVRPVADHYRHLFSLLAGRFGGPVIVERTSGSIRSVRLLREAFPEARFVYLSRDGVECALSMSRHAGCRTPAFAAAPDPDLIGGARTQLAAFGQSWSAMTVAGATELARLPLERWTALRYEDLVKDPAGSLRDLTRFLGAAAAPEWLAAASAQVEPARIGVSGTLAPEDLAALRLACAPGYAADGALHASHGPVS